MQSARIRDYEQNIEQTWESYQHQLQDNFSVSTVVGASEGRGYSISNADWDAYFKQLVLSKSKIRLFDATNDNDIRELSEVEIDYVIGGVAALPVLAIVIAVYTVAVTSVSAAVSAVVVVYVGAAIVAAVTVYVTS